MNDMEEKSVWLSASEIAKLKLNSLPHSRGAVLKWANERGWEKMNRKGRGAGFVYSFSSFPEDAKQEIKADSKKWQLVQEISNNRGKYQGNIKISFEDSSQTDLFLSPKEKSAVIEAVHRLVVEEYRLGIKREELANKLGISLEELEKYELAQKPLNVLHFQKLHELGFNLMFIILGDVKK